MVTTDEEKQLTQSIECHCSEHSLAGATEVQEWKVELDNAFPEADGRPSSSVSNRSVGSPDSITDHHTMLVSPHVPPADSVTQYSLLETKHVEVSYTFYLESSKY